MGRDVPTRVELLQGTLDLLILRTLLAGPAHGYAIAQQTKWHTFSGAMALILNPVDRKAQ